MPLNEAQLLKRENFKSHMQAVNKQIMANIKLLADSPVMPVKSLLDICRQQGDLANTMMWINNTGQQLFKEEWADKPVLGMNGHAVKSEDQL